MKRFGKLREYLLIFLFYFVISAFIITCSFLVFFQNVTVPSPDSVRLAAIYTFLNVLFITLLFVVISAIHRKVTVDRPVRQIRDALAKITNGDFSVRLQPKGARESFADIMEQINRMTEELSGVETLRTDFIANVSHEMKTPLAVMQNYGTLLQMPNLSEEQRIEYAKGVTDSARRMAEMMTNILNLNRLENQQIFPQTASYDLSEQLCGCLLQFESIWEQKQIAIDTDIAQEVQIFADAELLSLVWNNLFSNAFKFTEAGGTVFVSLRQIDEDAVVEVRDTGCGMAPEVGAHIFEKFYQGDRSHAAQGNGLGLSLVKRVVDIVQGEIRVESSVDAGSTFTVRIPCHCDEATKGQDPN
ncbi:MAG: HAMP domain-containing sensor histidine kinase [Oscillospiraceae bacterium]|nr:HAMP domain-containing sensor histidine kinase [Oscillospiraceae bacterium]